MKEYDLGFIVPLNEEFRVLGELCTIIDTEIHDAIHYHTLNLPYSEYQAVAVVLGGMGKNLAGQVTEKVLNYVKVKAIVLLGIAGALDKDLKLGDVVVASEINEFQAASKAVQKAKSFVFRYSGNHWKTSFALMQCAGNFEFSARGLYNRWRSQVRDFRDSLGLKSEQLRLANDVPEVKIGHIASGDTVSASEAYAIELQGIDRKFLAIEMEAAGFAQAAYGRTKPIETMVVRGISDFAEGRKQEFDSIGDGAWRKYAMYSASTFLLYLTRAKSLQEVITSVSPKASNQAHEVASPFWGIPSDKYSRAGVRRFVLDALSEQELRELIVDHFPEVGTNISSKYSLREMVDALLECCGRKGRIDELVYRVKEINPHQYDRFRTDLSNNH